MLKQILIAIILVIGLQLLSGVLPVSAPLAQAQGELSEGDLGSEHFTLPLEIITHDRIEGLTREGWIRRGINYFFEKIIGFMAAVIGSLSVLVMSYGGFTMLTSGGGDSPRYEKGKNMVKYSLIGLGVTLMAYILVTLVQLLVVSIYD